jgi:hypothetical protein
LESSYEYKENKYFAGDIVADQWNGVCEVRTATA